MDAIIVAADHFKNLSGVQIENKKIILMTNFKVPTANAHEDVQIVNIFFQYIFKNCNKNRYSLASFSW